MKMILLFSVITIVTIIAFSYFMFISMSQTVIRRELDNQKAAMESVDNYIRLRYESVQSMALGIYRNEALSANVAYFLEHPYQQYLQYSIDQYYNSAGSYSSDALQYFKNQLDEHGEIRNLMLYSSDQQNLYTYDQNKQFKMISTNYVRSYVPDAMALETKNVAPPNYWVRKAIGQMDPRLYAVRVPLNNKQTLKNIGQLLVYFDSEQISNALTNYKDSLKGTIVVLSAEGQVLYDSSGRYYGQKYPYAQQAEMFYESSESGTVRAGEEMYISRLASTEGGYQIVGAAPGREISAAYAGLRNTIMTISAICILFAVLIPSLFVINYAKRTNQIIKFTRRVKNGDLKARIQDYREDELGQISKSFNDMLDELNLYIDRVYKAEIKQKHTELAALQARINPHFLYNTLEVIRMRAISQGARDVGEMIYSLSVLFKSFVQQKRIQTLKDELEACRLYLELFRIRYKDKFSYSIESPAELSSKRILKLSLQPIIENYIVHGIRTDAEDNRLRIAVWREGNTIRAIVEDNGRGIDSSRLEELHTAINQPEEEAEGSFGLRSVHARLRFLHGQPYGLSIESEQNVGTRVTIVYPLLEGESAEHV
ncbi:sensor histidine kinase [Paenibacillus sp. CAA11]|uniref:sensor histidine kinase n=1 Tax=Paenibacillus sp. CAA11 TaxID=1532905 RepID=UPI0019001CC4|nr:histidine kinase [Paenibacillus sp. CAA11]